MSPEVVRIISYVLAGLSIAFAITAMMLFVKLKIVQAIRELQGKTTVIQKKVKSSNIKSTLTNEPESEDEGFDETVALVADENTYINFKIIKNIIYVNTAEIIS